MHKKSMKFTYNDALLIVNNWAKDKFIKENIDYDESGEVPYFIQYLNYRSKLVIAKPRNVILSKQFSISPENKKGFDKKGFTPKYQKTNNPDVIFGRDFEDNFIKLSDLVGEIGEVVVRGKIIEVDSRYLERSDSTLYIFAITDFSDSIYVKMFVRSEQLDVIKENIVKGNYVKINGLALVDKFDSELTVSSVKGIKKCEKYYCEVDTSNGPSYGAMLVDVNYFSGKEPNVYICSELYSYKYKEYIYKTLKTE